MNTKIEEFIRRSRYRNPHLYTDLLEEGYDYVVCPVSKARMSMIKSSYIERVLGMTVNEYDDKHPKVQKIALARKINISNGLKKIDPLTGKTKYDLSQEKAKTILNTVDPVTGLSGYAAKGIKTRATHMANVDEFGGNGYSRIASKAIIKGNATKVSRQLIIPPGQKNFLSRYRTVVQYLTNKHRSQLTAGYITGLAVTPGAWHLDHKYSIQRGFRDKISPFVIGHAYNLEMLPWQNNVSKSASCSLPIETLFTNTGFSAEQSLTEFNLIMDFIYQDAAAGITPNAAFLLERFHAATLR